MESPTGGACVRGLRGRTAGSGSVAWCNLRVLGCVVQAARPIRSEICGTLSRVSGNIIAFAGFGRFDLAARRLPTRALTAQPPPAEPQDPQPPLFEPQDPQPWSAGSSSTLPARPRRRVRRRGCRGRPVRGRCRGRSGRGRSPPGPRRRAGAARGSGGPSARRRGGARRRSVRAARSPSPKTAWQASKSAERRASAARAGRDRRRSATRSRGATAPFGFERGGGCAQDLAELGPPVGPDDDASAAVERPAPPRAGRPRPGRRRTGPPIGPGRSGSGRRGTAIARGGLRKPAWSPGPDRSRGVLFQCTGATDPGRPDPQRGSRARSRRTFKPRSSTASSTA